MAPVMAGMGLRPRSGPDVWWAYGTGTNEYKLIDDEGMNAYPVSMKATVSEKGQVTIPKPLRTRLGIRPGAVLDFEADNGRLIVRKADERNPVDAVWGTLDLGEPVDAFIERIRGR